MGTLDQATRANLRIDSRESGHLKRALGESMVLVDAHDEHNLCIPTRTGLLGASLLSRSVCAHRARRLCCATFEVLQILCRSLLSLTINYFCDTFRSLRPRAFFQGIAFNNVPFAQMFGLSIDLFLYVMFSGRVVPPLFSFFRPCPEGPNSTWESKPQPKAFLLRNLPRLYMRTVCRA